MTKNKILNFRNKAKKIDLPLKQLELIGKAFKVLNGKVMMVGGVVRNIILSKKEIVDTDLVTDLNPDEMVRCFKISKIRYLETGMKFGTITAIVEQTSIQITSLRQDILPDGRWTKVVYTKNWFLDSQRRDFTINAIYLNLDGEIFDPFDGINDLKKKKVIFIGNPRDRIKEDYLRILRFLRFSIQYSEVFDKVGLKECMKMKSKLNMISFERRYSEFIKMISYFNFEENFKKLIETNILNYIFGLKIYTKNIEKYFKIEKSYKFEDPLRRVKFFLRAKKDLSSRDFYNKLSNDVKKRIQFKFKFKNYDFESINYKLYYHSKTLVLDQLIFDFVDGLVQKKIFDNLLNFIKTWKRVKFPISGNDLILIGYNNGLIIGRNITIIEKWWLKRLCSPDRKSCLDYEKTLPRS